MTDIYPLTIVKDRYSGTYSGGLYTAWNADFANLPLDIDGSDPECMTFWSGFHSGNEITNRWAERIFVGLGGSPNEALEDLEKQLAKENT